jgi:hypothetical protein
VRHTPPAPRGCGDRARVAAHAHVPTSGYRRPHVVDGRRPHVVVFLPHVVVFLPHVVLRPHVVVRAWLWHTLMYLLLTCRGRAGRGPGIAF